MSKLYADLSSDAARNVVTRRGHHQLRAHLRGWNDGVEVEVAAGPSGRVGVRVFRTGGSNDPGRVLVAQWHEDEPTRQSAHGEEREGYERGREDTENGVSGTFVAGPPNYVRGYLAGRQAARR